MGLFSKLTSSVSTNTGQALRDMAAAYKFESLEDRQLLSLMIDLRLAGGGKSVTVSAADQIVNMEVWATVRGDNGDGSDDGLNGVAGSFLSADVGGGAARGTLSAALVSPFTSSGSNKGGSSDLDGDGDADVGSNDNANTDGFFFARAGSAQFDGQVSGDSNSFKIGTLTFHVTQLLSGTETRINFRARDLVSNDVYSALWVEDGTAAAPQYGDPITIGSPVVLKRAGGGTGGGSIDASVANGLLTVRGTDAANDIKVTLNGDNLIAEVDGQTKSFAASTVSKIRVLGLDGNDTILIGSTVNLPARLEGGNGNDKLTGSSGKDTLYGGDGNDNLKGLAGNDFLDGGLGADKISGGKGIDTASYKTRTNAVRVSIDDSANDGEAKEGDNVRYDIENVYGGAGNDKLIGSTDDNYLRGYGGNDILMGGKGNDTLDGGSGADKLFGEDGNDRLFARDGARDSVYGGAGKDRAQLDKADIRKDVETLLS